MTPPPTRDAQARPIEDAAEPAAPPRLTPEEKLHLHQLQTMEILERLATAPDARPGIDQETAEAPERWELVRGVELYPWQRQCVEAWFTPTPKTKGTIKVVTGAGKTVLALAIAERLQREVDPGLRVAIVVPTIVLMNQWYDELVEHSNLPPALIGRLGGGFQDDFSESRRVLVAVLVSASQKLPRLASDDGVQPHLLLIVDECHRAGAGEMRKVLDTQRTWSLGLSATPERDDEEEPSTGEFEDIVVGRALGEIVYEMTLADAFRLGLLPPFRILHYGLPLNDAERQRYEQLTRQASDAERELRAAAPRQAAGGRFFAWLRGAAQRGDVAPLAARYLGLVDRRRRLLFGVEARRRAVRRLLTDEITRHSDTRAILFHEQIDEVNQLFVELRADGVPGIAEHSKLPDSLRAQGIRLFRDGVARVIVSARSLVEGFNVPEADVGIIVASSKSVRQRIQSLGRLLRKHRDASGEEKTSTIHVLYAKDTVDELIYEKVDWPQITGAAANEFFVWDGRSEPIQQDGPPRRPLPGEDDIDASQLTSGSVYPGRYEGEEYSCDHMGNVTDAAGQHIESLPEDVIERIRDAKGGYGRFRVTPGRHLLLVRVPGVDDDWATLYVATLAERLKALPPPPSPELSPDEWARAAKPGDEYPFPVEGGDALSFGQRRGGVIKRKAGRGEVYARVGGQAVDSRRGADAERLLAVWKELRKSHPSLTQFEIIPHRHAVFRQGGRMRFIAALEAGLEFPVPESGLEK